MGWPGFQYEDFCTFLTSSKLNSAIDPHAHEVYQVNTPKTIKLNGAPRPTPFIWFGWFMIAALYLMNY